MFRKIAAATLFVASLSLSGCIFPTSRTTVKGVVMLSGRPVSGAEVTFGGKLTEVRTITGPDGKFTLTARHRPTQMLELKASKTGYGQYEEIKFPGFAAPDGEIKVELIHIIPRTR